MDKGLIAIQGKIYANIFTNRKFRHINYCIYARIARVRTSIVAFMHKSHSSAHKFLKLSQIAAQQMQYVTLLVAVAYATCMRENIKIRMSAFKQN